MLQGRSSPSTTVVCLNVVCLNLVELVEATVEASGVEEIELAGERSQAPSSPAHKTPLKLHHNCLAERCPCLLFID